MAQHENVSQLKQPVEAKKVLSTAMEAISPTMNEVKDFAEHAVSEAADRTTKVVKRYPLASIGVGFGIGCLVGLLVRRS